MGSPGNRVVCVVDDDEAVRESTSLLLESSDIAVRSFEHPRDFLHAFDSAEIGCIILDVHMPEMSGPAVLAALRDRGVRTPVIMLTGRSDAGVEAAARKYDATLLNKPVTDETLITLVRAALGRHV